MNAIPFKGTDTIATILSTFGKIKTNGTKPFTLTFDSVQSALALVSVPCVASKAEKESALAILTDDERGTLARLQEKVKNEEKRLASARVNGQTSERWTTSGNVTID